MAEILEFIQRRFSDNCHWLDGNCYYFAVILCERFDKLAIYYEPIEGHFVAGDGELFYDWLGLYISKKLIPLDKIKEEDPSWYKILIRDCVM